MSARLGAVLCLASVSPVVFGQGGGESGPDLKLVNDVRSVAARVERLRGVSLRPVPTAMRAPDEACRIAADATIARRIGAARLAARGRAWADVGLGSASSPLWVYRTLIGDLDGVCLDPDRRRLLVAPDRLSDADFVDAGDESLLMATGLRPDEPLIAHALVHHLQQLRENDPPVTTDAILAAAAWAEGEANLVSLLMLFEGIGLGVEALGDGFDPGRVMQGALLPSVLERGEGVEWSLLDWVYRDGFLAALDRFRSGGFDLLTAAAAARPATRDVMHLERPALDRPGPPPAPGLPEGLELVDRDTLGERAIVELVSRWTGKTNLGLIAADGWAGDWLYRAEGPGGGVTLWSTRWLSEEMAADFEDAYRRVMAARTGRPVEPDAGGDLRASDDRAVLRLRRFRTEVRVQVAAPGLDRAIGGPVEAEAP